MLLNSDTGDTFTTQGLTMQQLHRFHRQQNAYDQPK